MSRFFLSLCVVLALASFASAHHTDQQLVLSCPRADCNGATSAEGTIPTQCHLTNVTSMLGECVKLNGEDVYARVYCHEAQKIGSIALFGADHTCHSDNLVSVVGQKESACLGSRIIQCGHETVAVPKTLTDKAAIVKSYCASSSCGGDCTNVAYVVDKCVNEFNVTGSKYGKCVPNNGGSHVIMQQSWMVETIGEQALTCSGAANITETRAVGVANCNVELGTPKRYPGYVKYECGNTVTGAAAFTAPAISMMAALVAMLAIVARMQ